MSDIKKLLPDFPEGPLDRYRKQASFDWRSMALIMDNEERLKFKHSIWKSMEDDPTFLRSPDESEASLDDIRNKTLERALKLSKILSRSDCDLRTRATIYTIVGHYDWSVSIRLAALLSFFSNAIRGLGTQNHYKYIDAAEENELFGCVCITEIGHGTNLRGLRTTATFDANQQKFILHSPDFQAAKCWAANLGKTANYAYIMAQLYDSEGNSHGLHGFIVPIRDAQLNTLPGVIIGDMGPKAGLNGLDNGFLMFNNYLVSKDCLLNKSGDINVEGKYITPFKDKNKKFGASLGNLSGARLGIVSLCAVSLCNAVTIGIRYSAVRRQFGNPGSDELPVIEYQMQQWRLFPYLAAAYVLKYFGAHILDNMIAFFASQFNTEDVSADVRALWGTEMHAVGSSAKPIAGWLARDAIQECREACGGHGYLTCSGISRIRNDNDAFLTFEGENNVLMQQTSNWLINIWNDPKRDIAITQSKLRSLTFLNKAEQRLKKTFRVPTVETLTCEPKCIIEIYKWLVCYKLRSTASKYQELLAATGGEDSFSARNKSQVFFARSLSLAYIEHFMIETFQKELCDRPGLPTEIRSVLRRILVLYGLWSLEKYHLGTLYEGGYFCGPQPSKLIREGILKLCEDLKPDAVALVDAIAPTDFALNSVLGASDGQVYKRLEMAMSDYPGSYGKSSRWPEFAGYLKSKL